jgi:predicted nuclease of restriction endonuclease-like (RecB) superfamily
MVDETFSGRYKRKRRKIGPIGEKHRQQKHPSEDQNGQVPKTKMKNGPIALEQLDQKRHWQEADCEKQEHWQEAASAGYRRLGRERQHGL